MVTKIIMMGMVSLDVDPFSSPTPKGTGNSLGIVEDRLFMTLIKELKPNCQDRGFPGGAIRTHLPVQETQETRVSPWVGKIPWRRAWRPTPVFLSGECHGQRSLVGSKVTCVLHRNTHDCATPGGSCPATLCSLRTFPKGRKTHSHLESERCSRKCNTADLGEVTNAAFCSF